MCGKQMVEVYDTCCAADEYLFAVDVFAYHRPVDGFYVLEI
jgi:hypothetical protein